METQKRAYEIGRAGHAVWIWLACEDCGKYRWVQETKIAKYCKSCGHKNCNIPNPYPKGDKSRAWKGGRRKARYGYIEVFVSPDDFFSKMRRPSGKYVFEHRLVMAKHLGRCLHPWEIVHHKNGIKDDNRIENLQLVTDDRHKQITFLETRINVLEKRVTILEAENIILRGESCQKSNALSGSTG